MTLERGAIAARSSSTGSSSPPSPTYRGGGSGLNSGPSQSEWLLRKRRNQLSACQVLWQRLMLYHRQKCLCLLTVLVVVSIVRLNPSFLGRRSKTSFRIPQKIKFPPSEKDLNRLNAVLKDPDQILQWAIQQFAVDKKSDGDNSSSSSTAPLVQFTSFGPSGMVILDKIYRMGKLHQIPVVTIDTLHLFRETYELWHDVMDRYSFKFHIYTPAEYFHGGRLAFDKKYGPNLWKTDPEQYGHLTKVEPMQRALDELQVKAWITGRRRSQGGERSNLQALELADDGRLKINPLVYWSYDDVWDYILQYQVPYNALHDSGFKSVGDMMTSRAVAPSAPERSGRFFGLNKTECGMHAHLEKVKRMKQEAEDNKQEFVMPTLPCEDCIDVDDNTFEKNAIDTNTDVLVEFYSPLCGACQEFAPIMNSIAKKLRGKVPVIRYDITSQELTTLMVEQGFAVEVTPTIYLVQHNPLRLTLYEKEDHDEFSILDWIAKKLPNVNLSS